jgi:VWFA-related protein
MRRPQPSRLAALLPLLTLAALVLFAAPRVTAQKPEELPPLVEEITVEVVNVDVVVTDRHGNPVNGLTRDEFVLFEDGKRREISNFYAFVQGRAQIAAGAGGERAPAGGEVRWADPATRRRMVLLFDSASLEKRMRNRSIEALERFILEQFDGTYEWAVIAYHDRLQLMEPFTSEKTRVLAALARVRDLPVPVRRQHAGDALFSEEPIVKSRASGLGPQPNGNEGAGVSQLTTLEFDTRERMLSEMRSFSSTTAALVQTMRAFAGMSGRKSLVLISGGLEALPGPAQLLGRGFPGAGSANRVDPFSAVLHTELLRRFDLIVKTANAAGFVIYPVSSFTSVADETPYLDVERVANLAFKGGYESMPAEIDFDTAPRIMAEGTGGEYYATTHFYRAFDDIDSRTANAYVLGFQTNRAPDGKYHKLRVETTRPGLVVKSREGFVHISREDKLIDELTTPLTFPKDRGDFVVAVEIDEPERLTEKYVTVTVAGVVPLEEVTLIPQGDEMVGRVYVYVAVYDERGDLVSLFRERQDVRLPAAKVAAAPPNAPARFGLTLKDLERGSYRISLTLLDEVTDRYGTGVQSLQM